MVEIIGVRFNNAGKMYYFDPKGLKVKIGENVLVETARGIEMGHVVVANSDVEDEEIVAPLKSIIRIANKEDFVQLKENKEKEKDAFIIANEQIREHGIEMKLVDVEYTFDRSKILFYFTADGRVDFRELVKSLAGIFHTRIELRQIGVRDEARQLGSFGICGRYVCCGTFLDDFKPVSIRMAKDQGLSLNPTKISGVCGRLMCCLQYEQNVYEDISKRMPNKGALVETPDGRGVIVDVATLKEEVRVKFDDGEVVRFGNYKVSDITDKNGKKFSDESIDDKNMQTVEDDVDEAADTDVKTANTEDTVLADSSDTDEQEKDGRENELRDKSRKKAAGRYDRKDRRSRRDRDNKFDSAKKEGDVKSDDKKTDGKSEDKKGDNKKFDGKKYDKKPYDKSKRFRGDKNYKSDKGRYDKRNRNESKNDNKNGFKSESRTDVKSENSQGNNE